MGGWVGGWMELLRERKGKEDAIVEGVKDLGGWVGGWVGGGREKRGMVGE